MNPIPSQPVGAVSRVGPAVDRLRRRHVRSREENPAPRRPLTRVGSGPGQHGHAGREGIGTFAKPPGPRALWKAAQAIDLRVFPRLPNAKLSEWSLGSLRL